MLLRLRPLRQEKELRKRTWSVALASGSLWDVEILEDKESNLQKGHRSKVTIVHNEAIRRLLHALIIKDLLQSLFKSIGIFLLTSKGLLIKSCLLSRVPLSLCHNLALAIRGDSD